MLAYSISPTDLWNLIATPAMPQIVDVRRRDVYVESPTLLPGACWREHAAVNEWARALDRARPVVVACKSGHEVSQTAVAQLRADGIDACVLAGGFEAWASAGLPFVNKGALD